MQPQPLISVCSVPESRRWYESVLQLQSKHGGDEYDRLYNGNYLVLQLHLHDAHDHPHLGKPPGQAKQGVLLWFQTQSFDDMIARANAAQAEILEGPRVNTSANHREVWLRDPDGYVVVIAGSPGDLGNDTAD